MLFIKSGYAWAILQRNGRDFSLEMWKADRDALKDWELQMQEELFKQSIDPVGLHINPYSTFQIFTCKNNLKTKHYFLHLHNSNSVLCVV